MRFDYKDFDFISLSREEKKLSKLEDESVKGLNDIIKSLSNKDVIAKMTIREKVESGKLLLQVVLSASNYMLKLVEMGYGSDDLANKILKMLESMDTNSLEELEKLFNQFEKSNKVIEVKND